MIHFEWPWLVAALPLPWLLRHFTRALDHRGGAVLRVPSVQDFAAEAAGARRAPALRRWPLWVAFLAWVLLVGAAMRPQWLGELVQVPVSGRDLMLAVDLSGSMQEEDFILRGTRVDRLTAAQAVAGEFIQRRVGDRIGLILFGERAYLQAPLTFDRDTVRRLLDEAVIGLAGKATAIGDAIGLAVKRLRNRPDGNRVLILLTDGANTAGVVEPLEAAALAAREGLRIYTIGIGADEMLVRDFFGLRRVNPSAELDEETLRAIAERTGGRYFRARDVAELEEIYRILDRIEPVQQDAAQLRPQKALFHWPLAGALLLATMLLVLRLAGRLP
jgi:Ca-activated chloride channel family protein